MLLLRGRIYAQMPRYQKALADVTAVLDKDPHNSAALHLRGDVRMELADYRGAVHDYSSELASHPDDTEVLFLRAVAYEKLGEHDKALGDIADGTRLGDYRAKADFAEAFTPQKPRQAAVAPKTPSSENNLTAADLAAIVAPSSANAHTGGAHPPLARRLEEEGSTIVNFYVGTDGRVYDPTVASSSGFPDLDKAAMRAVLPWRYHPATLHGKPIVVRTKAAITWMLDGTAASDMLGSVSGRPPRRPGKYVRLYEEARSAATLEGNPRKAIRLLSQILEAPDLPRGQVYTAHLARSSLYLMTGQTTRAIADLNDVLRETPDSEQALMNRASAYMSLQENRKAIRDLRHVSQIAPNDLRADTDLAELEIQEHNYSSAAVALTKLLHRTPEDRNALEMRASAYKRLGHYDAAAGDLLHARALDRKHFGDTEDLCVDLSRSRHPATAIGPCKQATATDADGGDVRSGLAIACFRLGKFRDTMRNLRVASRTYPGNAEYLYAVGAAESKIGDTADGRRDMAGAESLSHGIAKRMARFGIVPQEACARPAEPASFPLRKPEEREP